MSPERGPLGADVDLPAGRRLVIRPIEPTDAERLDGLFGGLSADDLYRRFFSAFRPQGWFLEKMVDANERGATALLALVEDPDGTEIAVGEASAWPLPNGNGELGLTVASDWRGWLGPYLLDVLLRAAAGAGIPNLEADVLLTNPRMLALLRARGSAVIDHDGYRSVRLAVSTTGTVPSWPPADSRLRVLIESPTTRWEVPELGLPPGSQVMACSGPGARPGSHPCPVQRGEPCPLAATADVIVVRDIEGDDLHELRQAHAKVHPGVPVHINVCEAPAAADEG